jgi:glycerol-3-phosphate dehydrogenase
VVGLALQDLSRTAGPSPTLNAPLPGAKVAGNSEIGAFSPTLTAKAWWTLIERYGSRAVMVARIAQESPGLDTPLADSAPAIGAEVLFAVRHEMACNVSDFVIRRASLGWRAPRQLEVAARRAAQIMGAELHWDASKIDAEVAGLMAFSAARTLEAATPS